jgi:tetratricopeptide (TPR) repeat protein
MFSPTELKAQGLAHFRAERYDEAAEAFAEAASAFAAQGERGAAAEMMNNAAVVCLARQQWEMALNAAQGTPAVFHALGDKLREAQALSNVANALENLGRLDEAAPLYEQAIDLFSALGEKENRAACWKALSNLQIKQDKKLQALASMQAGLNLVEDLSPREKTLKGLLDKAMKLIGGRS